MILPYVVYTIFFALAIALFIARPVVQHAHVPCAKVVDTAAWSLTVYGFALLATVVVLG